MRRESTAKKPTPTEHDKASRKVHTFTTHTQPQHPVREYSNYSALLMIQRRLMKLVNWVKLVSWVKLVNWVKLVSWEILVNLVTMVSLVVLVRRLVKL